MANLLPVLFPVCAAEVGSVYRGKVSLYFLLSPDLACLAPVCMTVERWYDVLLLVAIMQRAPQTLLGPSPSDSELSS